ncbi:MAG: hypothetical protein U1D06_02685 [Paracoccaceae bacterium]|nr:hypothetical protein [Paracoccaceae bacterium]
MKTGDQTVLTLCLPSPLREDAAAGRVNIVNRIGLALAPAGWRLLIEGNNACDHAAAVARGYALLHMHEPESPRALCLRRAYHYPFWHIEATNQRWNFDVARAGFCAETVNPGQAAEFFRRWRAKILGDQRTTRDGFVFVPLQGRLLQQRSFQAASPLAMIEAVLQADPNRRVLATLHPNEIHDPAEIAALDALEARFPRFRRVAADAKALLGACDHVVTQNSSVALSGYFAGKPAVLFAGIDFHHIAGSVPRDGQQAAFAQLQGPAPDFAAYVYWFFKLHAVNGGAPEAEDQIRARFRRFGWPL